MSGNHHRTVWHTVKFRWSRDHNNRTAENAFSAPWYYSEIELEPLGLVAFAVNDGFPNLYM